MCFFDRESSEIRPRCKQILLEFAAAWDRLQQRRAGATANTDASLLGRGPIRVDVLAYAPDGRGPEHGRRLSVRRAMAVASALHQAGVPDDLISTVSFTDENMLVPGKPLDPQNRYANMILR